MASSESGSESKNNEVAMQECYENYIVVDIGANLTNKKYGRDLDSVIQRAKDAGNFGSPILRLLSCLLRLDFKHTTFF